jgi:hypothetical protein
MKLRSIRIRSPVMRRKRLTQAGANKRFFHRVRATIGLGLPGTARLLRRSTPSGISAPSAAGRGISEMLLLTPPRLVLPSVPVRIVLAAGAFSPLNAKV